MADKKMKKIVSCITCGQEFNKNLANKKEFKQNLEIHRQKECYKYACRECDEEFSDKLNLLLHISRDHESKRYQYSICGQIFKQTSRSGIKIQVCQERGDGQKLLYI